jgi:hypothetical protein
MLSDPSRWGEDGVFDPATVIGLNSHHSVLVLGNAAFMPWLTKENNNITSVRKVGIASMTVANENFDRIIVGKEYEFKPNELLLQAEIGLSKNRGILIYFPKTEGDAWSFKNNVDAFYPTARIWESNTTFGQVIQVELNGGYNV